MPSLPGEIDGMAKQVETFPVAGFKTYTQFGPATAAASSSTTNVTASRSSSAPVH